MFLFKSFFEKEKKGLLKNFFSLSILQIANYLFPLIIIPYLVRVIGPEKFGLIFFAQALTQFFIIFTDYGFNLSATRQISIYRNEPRQVSSIFFSIILIKSAFCLLSFLILMVLFMFVDKFSSDWQVYFFTFGMVLGNVLFPLWFFQGLEKMEYITVLNVLSKLLFVVLIFIFIKQASHYIYVPLLNSITLILFGFISLWLSFKQLKLIVIMPDWQTINKCLQEGMHIFFSHLSTTLYSNANPFILGLLTSNIYVGYYVAGEKIIRALISLSIPASNTIFPRVSQMFLLSKENAFKFLQKVAIYGGVVFLIISILTYVCAHIIVDVVLGVEFRESIVVIRLLAILPLTVFLDNIFGTQILINIRKEKIFSKIILAAGILNIGFLFLLVPSYKHIGSALSFLFAEIFILVGMFFFARKYGFRLFISGRETFC